MKDNLVYSSFPRAICLTLLCITPLGCGPQKGDVSGTVTYKSEKIPLGRITFQSQGGRMESVSGRILDGQYEVKDVPWGPTKVSIETYGTSSDSKVKEPPAGLQIAPKDMGDMSKAKKLVIPMDYASPEKSGLTFEVTAKTQTKNFELK